jgi:hypothetical protein
VEVVAKVSRRCSGRRSSGIAMNLLKLIGIQYNQRSIIGKRIEIECRSWVEL